MLRLVSDAWNRRDRRVRSFSESFPRRRCQRDSAGRKWVSMFRLCRHVAGRRRHEAARGHEKWARYRFVDEIRQFVNMQSWVYRYNTIVDPTLNSVASSLPAPRKHGTGNGGTRRLVIRIRSPREHVHSLFPFMLAFPSYASVSTR